ncbi:tyrosine-protein kinase family protein [Rhodovulum sp. DZ06]|uniref:tyrosine-protein kinase family protein n=1 Tax=Rhodovulum sp. DZ06 TaxID=3425126 RepID=UPI003D333A75
MSAQMGMSRMEQLAARAAGAGGGLPVLLGALRRARLWACAGALGAGALAAGWLHLNPPRFVSTAEVMVQDDALTPQAAMRLLQSDAVLGAVRATATDAAPVRFAAGLDAPDEVWSGAIRLHAEAASPREAARLAQGLAEAFAAERRAFAAARDARGLDWLQDRIAHLDSRRAALEARGASGGKALEEMRASLEILVADARAEAAARPAPVLISTPARAPERPVGPSRLAILLAGVALGGLLGGLASRARDRILAIPDTPAQLVRDCGLPVLAAAPPEGGGELAAAARRDPAGGAAEASRALREPLLRLAAHRAARHAGAGQVICVLGSSAGAGASSAAALAAESFARLGRSVCLVDGDLRSPDQARRYGLEGEVDLVSVIDGEAALDDALWPAATPGLFILPAAPAPAARVDALEAGAAEELLDALRQRFDVVVVDAPPPSSTAEGRLFAGLADACLLSVRWGAAGRAELAGAAAALRAARAATAGVLITRATDAAAPFRCRWSDARFARFAEGFGD